MTGKAAPSKEAAVIQHRRQLMDKLSLSWVDSWAELITGGSPYFERFCKPDVVRQIHAACGPFVLSGDRYDFNVDDQAWRVTGQDDPSAPATISFTLVHQDPRLDADRRVKRSHPGDPHPVRVKFVLETDPGITCIEKASAEIVSPRATLPRHAR